MQSPGTLNYGDPELLKEVFKIEKCNKIRNYSFSTIFIFHKNNYRYKLKLL